MIIFKAVPVKHGFLPGNETGNLEKTTGEDSQDSTIADNLDDNGIDDDIDDSAIMKFKVSFLNNS